MSRWTPFKFVGGAYKDDSRPWTAQDTVNYIPMSAERQGTRSPTRLVSAPGFLEFADTGTNLPIRGMHNAEGTLFVVAGTTLFRVGADSSTTALGTVPGVGRVKMAHNQITGGNQLAIANGSSGYVYNTYTDTFVQITDDAFPGAVSFAFLDQYILGVEPSRRFAFTSALLDATSYSTLDRYTAEGSPDPLVGQLVTHREWWLMGERTIEPYIDDGSATGTFERASGVVIEHGLASPYACAVLDNTAFWLGSDGVVYTASGYQPIPISTMAISEAISGLDWSKAFAFIFTDRGLKVFYLTFPDGQTWGYDAVSHEWHRRQSYGFTRWRINDLVNWNGGWYAGDYTNGLIYQLDWGLVSENGTTMERRRTSGVLADNENQVIVNGFKLVMDTGRPETAQIPFVASGHLPDQRSGISQTYNYTIRGNVPPTTVTVYAGTFPPGMSIDNSGLVTGTRGAAGTYAWTLLVEDSTGRQVLVADSDTTTAAYSWSFVPGDNQTEQIGRLSPAVLDRGSNYVLAGSDSHVFTSLDGKTWTQASTSAELPMYQCRGIATTLSAWFVIMADSGNTAHLYTSTDQGVTWSECLDGGSRIEAEKIVASDTCILAVNYFYPYARYSTDGGSTWTTATVPSGFNPNDSVLSYRGAIYVDSWNTWIIPGNQKIYEAEGSIPSVITEALTGTGRIGTAAYSPTLDRVVVAAPINEIYTRTKLGSWQTITLVGVTGYVTGICWADELGVFVGILQNTANIIESSDGLTWSVHPSTGIVSIIGSEGLLWMPVPKQMLTLCENNATYNPYVSNI